MNSILDSRIRGMTANRNYSAKRKERLILSFRECGNPESGNKIFLIKL